MSALKNSFLLPFLFALISVPVFSFAFEIPPHLRDVRELQERVLPANNSYRHSDQIVTWKGYNGASEYICHADCSGLIDALLIHTYHFSKAAMDQWLGKPHPKARDYFRVIQENKGFERIHLIKDVREGDFVAMEFLPSAQDKGHDTGHIMVVNALPKLIGPLEKDERNLTLWSLEVIDCSHGHGPTDSRYKDGSYHPGIGKGVAALYSNQEGVVVGYSWTPAEKSIFYGKDKRPLAVGRVKK